MMSQFKSLITLLSIATLLFIINGCSDDSPTGADEGDPPQIPEAAPVEIERSIFQNNSPTGEEYEAFNEAAALVEAANANMVGATGIGQSYLLFTQSQNATFEDGRWVWTFTFNEEGENITIKTTAEETTAGTEWNVYLTGNFEGESVNEFKYLTGIVSNDGDSGSWEYFMPGESGAAYLVYEWETISDSQFTFSTIIDYPDEDDVLRIDYERNGDDNSLEYLGFNLDQDVSVFWNSSTGIGYIDRPGEDRQCWDETFADTTCS